MSTDSCQQRIFWVENSNFVRVFNLFTKGSAEVASTRKGPAILANTSTEYGHTAVVNVWLPFTLSRNASGSDGFEDGNVVYADPVKWSNPNGTVGCLPPCIILFPPLPLPEPITVTWPLYQTGFYTLDGSSTLTTTTTISNPPFTIYSVPFWPVTIQPDDPTTGTISPVQSIAPPPTSIVITVTHWSTTTITQGGAGEAYCFNGNNAPSCNDPPYQEIKYSAVPIAVSVFCDASLTLQTSAAPLSRSYVDVDTSSGQSTTLYVAAGWADNQTDCGAEAAFPFSNICADRLWDTCYFCYPNGVGRGGGYVLKT